MIRSSSIRSEKAQLPAGTSIHANHAPRMIVLILNTDFDENKLARRIWQMAVSTHNNVLLLGLCQDSMDLIMLRRKLVTAAASIRDKNLGVEIQVIHGHRLVDIESYWQDSDLIIGLADKQGTFMNKILEELRQTHTQNLIFMITDTQPATRKKVKLLSRVGLWLGTIGIMAFFFWIQVQISRLPENWGQSALLIFSVFIELLILLVWDSITR